jgi:hypothetical protein
VATGYATPRSEYWRILFRHRVARVPATLQSVSLFEPESLGVVSLFFLVWFAVSRCVGREVHNQVSPYHFSLQTSRKILLRPVKNDPKPGKALGDSNPHLPAILLRRLYLYRRIAHDPFQPYFSSFDAGEANLEFLSFLAVVC